jgi:glutathione S-transferase
MVGRGEPPNGAAGYGTYDNLVDVVARAVAGGPYLLGDAFTTADLVMGSQLIWGLAVKAFPSRPEVVAYTNRLQERPALKRVFAKDAELVAAQAG